MAESLTCRFGKVITKLSLVTALSILSLSWGPDAMHGQVICTLSNSLRFYLPCRQRVSQRPPKSPLLA